MSANKRYLESMSCRQAINSTLDPERDAELLEKFNENSSLSTAPYWQSVGLFLDENSSNLQGKPTLVTRGMFKGYSMPTYAVGEELFFRLRVPFRWDGVTNPWFCAITSTSGAEDIGDKYKFQLEWSSEDVGNVIPDSTTETLTQEIVLTDGTAFFATIFAVELDATTLISGQNWQGRLKRITSAAPAVTNEIIVFHWCSRWRMNKLGTLSIQGYDG